MMTRILIAILICFLAILSCQSESENVESTAIPIPYYIYEEYDEVSAPEIEIPEQTTVKSESTAPPMGITTDLTSATTEPETETSSTISSIDYCDDAKTTSVVVVTTTSVPLTETTLGTLPENTTYPEETTVTLPIETEVPITTVSPTTTPPTQTTPAPSIVTEVMTVETTSAPLLTTGTVETITTSAPIPVTEAQVTETSPALPTTSAPLPVETNPPQSNDVLESLPEPKTPEVSLAESILSLPSTELPIVPQTTVIPSKPTAKPKKQRKSRKNKKKKKASFKKTTTTITTPAVITPSEGTTTAAPTLPPINPSELNDILRGSDSLLVPLSEVPCDEKFFTYRLKP